MISIMFIPYITEDDMMGVVFSRLKPEEYVLDVTADLQRNNSSYDLVFQRTVWYFPQRPTDNIMYNELMFFQSLPDYLEGLVVVLKDGRLSRRDEVCSQHYYTNIAFGYVHVILFISKFRGKLNQVHR